MKSVALKLNIDNIQQLVAVTERYPFDMDMRCGRYVVNAKSLLGLFSLDFSRPMTLDIYSDDCADLLRELGSFLKNPEGV